MIYSLSPCFLYLLAVTPVELDIAFILGAKGVQAVDNARKQKTILKHLLTSYNVSPGKTHVGIIRNTKLKASIALKIGQVQYPTALYKEVEKMKVTESGKLIDALTLASDQLFTAVNGARPAFKKSLVVFIDDKIVADKAALKAVGRELKNKGITTIVIDVTSKGDLKQLEELVPLHNVFFFPPKLDELDMALYPVIRALPPGEFNFSFTVITAFVMLSVVSVSFICVLFLEIPKYLRKTCCLYSNSTYRSVKYINEIYFMVLFDM